MFWGVFLKYGVFSGLVWSAVENVCVLRFLLSLKHLAIPDGGS